MVAGHRPLGEPATAIYQERFLPDGTLDSARLAVLVDALEEGGIKDASPLERLCGLAHTFAGAMFSMRFWDGRNPLLWQSPQPHGHIGAARQHTAPIRAERDADDAVGMSLETIQFLTTLGIPKPQGVIIAAG